MNEQELTKLQESLSEVVGSCEVEGVGTTMVTKLDAISSKWRQTWTAILKGTDQDGYVVYRAKKYPGIEDKPDLQTRRAAYEFAVERVLDTQYTEVECDEPTHAQQMVEQNIRLAVAITRVIDKDAYDSYKAMREAAGLDVSARRSAYLQVCKAFLQASYKLANV